MDTGCKIYDGSLQPAPSYKNNFKKKYPVNVYHSLLVITKQMTTYADITRSFTSC